MHEFVSFNSQITPAQKFFISGISPATFYGKSVFTTVAVYNSKPFLWSKHWRRLTANAKTIKIDISEISEQSIINSLTEIISANKIVNGRARLTFFDESRSPIWQDEKKTQTNFLINTADFRQLSPYFRLTISPFKINSASLLSTVKSGNYLENILALEDAQTKGFDEAIRLNERGEIVSACMANIFWQKDHQIFTPNLHTGCLLGTTRAFILENFSVNEKQAALNELFEAEQIFLTSAGIGIVQVAEFEGRKLNRENHEIIRTFDQQSGK